MDSVPQGSFIGTFLDSPIISSDRDAILAVLRRAGEGIKDPSDPAVRKALYLLKVMGSSNVVALEPEYYGWFVERLNPTSQEDLLTAALECEGAIMRVISRSSWSWSQLASGTLAPPPSLPTQAGYWYSRMLQLSDIITAVAVSRAKGGRQTIDKSSGNIRYVGDQYYGCICFENSDEWTLVTFTQLLMLKDMLYVRFNAYVASAHVYKDNQEMVSMLDTVIAWQMKCLGYYGNKGYELLKSIEALAKCNLTRMHDKYLAEEGSYQHMVEKVREKELKLSGNQSPLVDELAKYLEGITDTRVAVEIFGTQKFSGHPLVDPVMAGRSVREEASKKINYSPAFCQRLRNNCCRLYTEGYIKRNGRWPPLIFPLSSRRTRLYHLYSINELNVKRDSYPLEDWDGVRFGAHLTFEGFQNYLDLMDDKAVSYYREDCRATWDKRVSPHSHKRLLVELLSRGEFKVMDIVERVRRGDIPSSWLIVSLYPKERELKIAARLFSMMVLEMRVFFAACEANLAEYVYPCLEAQTMTLSKQEVKELFTSLTREYSDEQLVRLYLEVDLSRWNLRWHPEVVDPVGEDLNDMFGMEGVFNTIHHFFKKCLIMVRVNSAPPPGLDQEPIPESDLCFYDHEVGFEGIAQKLWSFLTFGMIDLAMIEHEGPYYLVGQGDNQVLLMTISLEGILDQQGYIKRLTTDLTEQIELECARVGQEAKPEECIQSTSVVTYSKNVYIRGTEYHTVIKGCSRIFPNASSDFPSINGSIGAISASCTSAAELMDNPLDAYRLMLFHLSLYLLSIKKVDWVETTYMSRGLREAMTKDVVMSILILPNDLGGCMVAPITAFLYKSGADTLSKSIASLCFYQEGSRIVRRVIHALEGGHWFDKNLGPSALLEDPYSLPIRRPKGADQSVKTESVDCIRSISSNTALSEVLSHTTEDFEEKLLRVLLSARPFNPVLLSDLIAFSVIGIKSNLQNMFTSTRTVQSLLHTSGSFEFSLCIRILMTGTLYFQDVVRRLTNLTASEGRIESIYGFANKLRSSWNHEGVTLLLVGVTAYTPFEFSISRTETYHPENGFRTLYKCATYEDGLHTRGEWPHYDGLDTKEKRSEYGYKIVTSTSAAAAVAKLAQIATQPGVDQSFVDVVSAIAATRADLDLRGVLPLLSKAIGGSIAHRYTATSGARGAYGLNTTTWSTHCVPYTDTVAPISASSFDYPVMVQEMMVAGIACARMYALQGQLSGVVTLLVIPEKITPLPDAPLTVLKVEALDPPIYKDNNLVYDRDIRLRKISGGLESPLIGELTETTSSEDLLLEAVRGSIRQSYLSNNTALRILDSRSRFVGFRLDVLEVLGIGVKRLCELMALEIAALAGNQTMISTADGVHWTPVPAIISLATAAAASLLPMLSHPLVRKDPFISDEAPLSLFKYSFIGAGVEKKVKSFITSTATRLLLSPGSKVYKSPEVLFSDDHANTSIYLVSRRLRLTLLQSVLLGELPPSAVGTIGRIVIVKSISGSASDEMKIERLSAAVSALLHWAEKERLPTLAAHVRHLMGGRFILSHKRASKEVIRIARSLRPLEISRSPAETTGLFSEFASKLPRWKVSDGDLLARLDEWGMAFAGFNMEGELFDADKRHFSIERLRGRVYGGDSNAVYSFACLADIFPGRVVLMIGCGYGSGAAMALVSGAVQVVGLDHREDLAEVELLRQNIVPPAVSKLSLDSRFVRVTVDAEYDGNFFSRATPNILKNYVGAGALPVIDIPIDSAEEAFTMLRQLQLILNAGSFAWRLKSSILVAESAIATLVISDILTEVRVVHQSYDHVEVWLLGQFSEKVTIKAGRLTVPLLWHSGVKSWPELSLFGGGKAYLRRAAMGPFCDLSIRETEIDAVEFAAIFSASIGGLDHRFSYDQFTTVLHALFIKKILGLPNPVEVLHRYIEDKKIQVTVGKRVFEITSSKELDLLIYAVIPRLL